MSKKQNNPVETIKLDIEFADNGIILRNPDIEDDVTLAQDEGPVYNIDYSKVYCAIGKKIYDWLTEEAVPEHADYWVSTGAKLHIKAELEGRTRKQLI